MERSQESKNIPNTTLRDLMHEKVDPNIPPTLLQTQQWLGELITQPFQADETLPALTPSGRCTEEECAEWISPSPTLKSYQRVTLYHQQYWWRLLKCLHSNFPLVTRLFGFRSFNAEIAIPYLSSYPPSHWSLVLLGENLPAWIRSHYPGEDNELVAYAADIDCAACHSFGVKSLPPIDFGAFTSGEILSHPLRLQPYVHLFALPLDLFSFREAFLEQEVDYWNTHPFPETRYGKFYFSLYRSPVQTITWKTLSAGEYAMLALFTQGLTINEACATIEKQGGEIYSEALDTMPLWFREWTQLGWLVSSN